MEDPAPLLYIYVTMGRHLALRILLIIGCVILLGIGVLTIVYSITGEVILSESGSSANISVANPIGLAVGCVEVALSIFGIWGAAKVAKFPLVLFCVGSMAMIALNVVALALYLAEHANNYVVLDFIWYILGIAFLLLLFIFAVILAKKPRGCCC